MLEAPVTSARASDGPALLPGHLSHHQSRFHHSRNRAEARPCPVGAARNGSHGTAAGSAACRRYQVDPTFSGRRNLVAPERPAAPSVGSAVDWSSLAYVLILTRTDQFAHPPPAKVILQSSDEVLGGWLTTATSWTFGAIGRRGRLR